VIALDTPAALIAQIGGDHRIEFAVAGGATLDDALLADLPATASVDRQNDLYTLGVTAPHLTLPALLERFNGRGITLSHLTTRHASLEDVFVKLTGRRLRDEGENK